MRAQKDRWWAEKIIFDTLRKVEIGAEEILDEEVTMPKMQTLSMKISGEESRNKQLQHLKSIFDFESNQFLTVQKIIKATFANPDRKKFKQSKSFDSAHPLYEGNIDAEALISVSVSDMPIAVRKFNQASLLLYDTSRLDKDIDLE